MVVVLLLLLMRTMMRMGLLSGERGEAPVPTMQQAVALQPCLSVAMVMMMTTIMQKHPNWKNCVHSVEFLSQNYFLFAKYGNQHVNGLGIVCLGCLSQNQTLFDPNSLVML